MSDASSCITPRSPPSPGRCTGSECTCTELVSWDMPALVVGQRYLFHVKSVGACSLKYTFRAFYKDILCLSYGSSSSSSTSSSSDVTLLHSFVNCKGKTSSSSSSSFSSSSSSSPPPSSPYRTLRVNLYDDQVMTSMRQAYRIKITTYLITYPLYITLYLKCT